ncbi:Cob(I)yrinic acid a,c-diamide adenosyltransferase [bioreactor metagenome]|uniref:Cob(I)yrinic acid a,c-diamide adenosyltransferase n=1 Tax=bioreactor metagenome TaxID=1076179 RepID=A0A644T1V8_9ZZZZ|nr:cob(I)yrinic acid a,c-diamide adenosyltransferase [Negativicutes bacterium]
MKTGKGLIRVFTGDGKGKTTAALGSALRAAGENRRVTIVQFLKGTGYTGELRSAKLIMPTIMIKQFGFGCYLSDEISSGAAVCTKCGGCFRENRNPINNFAPKALAYAREVLASGTVDLLVMDEISHAIKHKLLTVADVVDSLNSRTPHVEIILTGRNMPSELMDRADEITVCHPIKHPLANGLSARRGIEY